MTTTKTNVPPIRFSEFKDPWKDIRLNEFLEESKTRNTDLKFGKEHVLSVSGELGIVNQISLLGRSYAGKSVHNYHVVETNDIVYTKSPLKANPFGIIKLNKGVPGIVSTLYAVYRTTNQSVLGTFIDYYFSLPSNTNKYLRPLVKKGAKNDMKISNSYVLTNKIFIPTINEQKKIITFLKFVDQKLQHLLKKKELLENYKKSVTTQIFNNELKFTDSNGNNYPQWNLTTIGSITTVSAGATPSTINDKYWGGNVRWMNSGELNLKRVYEVENRITDLGLSKSSTKLLPKHCVLIGLAGQGKTRGTVAMNMVELCTNQSIAALYPNGSKFNEDFLYHNLDSRYDELRRLSTGEGGRGGLNLQIIKSLKIYLPAIEEQRKIANFLTSVDKLIELIHNEINQTEQWKKGLMQQLFV